MYVFSRSNVNGAGEHSGEPGAEDSGWSWTAGSKVQVLSSHRAAQGEEGSLQHMKTHTFFLLIRIER